MGVKFSKKKAPKKGKGDKDDKKKAKKKDYGKAGTPEALRKEITDVYDEFKGDKKMIEPLYYEKVGLTTMLNEEREKLLNLLAVMEKLKKDREPLMTACWEADADEIRRAFTKNLQTDKTMLVNVMACRTKWQVRHGLLSLETRRMVPPRPANPQPSRTHPPFPPRPSLPPLSLFPLSLSLHSLSPRPSSAAHPHLRHLPKEVRPVPPAAARQRFDDVHRRYLLWQGVCYL